MPGAAGVIRYVKSDVEYAVPPVSAGWKPVPAEPGRFDLPWSGDPGKAATLAGLRTELARAARDSRPASAGEPPLSTLDAVAERLTETAARLHRQGWSLGLIRPDNVVLREGEDGPDPVLVDLGFRWRGSYGPPPWDDSPGRPAWLAPDNGWAWLWDQPPVRRAFADPQNAVFPPPDPAEDVRTLGRLFAWVMSGRSDRDPLPIGGPAPPPCWDVLAAAAAGRIPTALDLRDRLRAAPLSGYYLAPLAPPPTPQPPPRGVMPFVAAVAAVAILGIGGGVYYASRPTPAPTTTPEASAVPPPAEGEKPPEPPSGTEQPAVPEAAGYDDLVKDFEAAFAKADLAGMAARLRALFALNLSAEKKAELVGKRDQFLTAWVAEYGKAVRLAGDPSQRLEAARIFRSLHDELKPLVESFPSPDPALHTKEQQCLALATDYARQLGSLR